MNPGIEAVRKLAHMGYRFIVNGDTIKAKYHGTGKPDPATVRPLLETVKAHKPEAIYFLKSYCPRCGGCCFAPDWSSFLLVFLALSLVAPYSRSTVNG